MSAPAIIGDKYCLKEVSVFRFQVLRSSYQRTRELGAVIFYRAYLLKICLIYPKCVFSMTVVGRHATVLSYFPKLDYFLFPYSLSLNLFKHFTIHLDSEIKSLKGLEEILIWSSEMSLIQRVTQKVSNSI